MHFRSTGGVGGAGGVGSALANFVIHAAAAWHLCWQRLSSHAPHDDAVRLKRFFNVYSDEYNYMNRRTLVHMMTVTLHSTEATERVAAAVDAWLNTMQPPLPGLHQTPTTTSALEYEDVSSITSSRSPFFSSSAFMSPIVYVIARER